MKDKFIENSQDEFLMVNRAIIQNFSPAYTVSDGVETSPGQYTYTVSVPYTVEWINLSFIV